MNDDTKIGIGIIIMAIIGIVLIIYGSCELMDARQSGDWQKQWAGTVDTFGGLITSILSLTLLMYDKIEMKIGELQKEREDLLEKMENMRTSNRIFDGRTEAFREDIIVLRDRMDYLEDRMQKESYSHDIEDEVF